MLTKKNIRVANDLANDLANVRTLLGEAIERAIDAAHMIDDDEAGEIQPEAALSMFAIRAAQRELLRIAASLSDEDAAEPRVEQ